MLVLRTKWITPMHSKLVFSQLRFIIPANIYLFKVGNRNIRERCEICSKLRIKTPEQRQ